MDIIFWLWSGSDFRQALLGWRWQTDGKSRWVDGVGVSLYHSDIIIIQLSIQVVRCDVQPT